ncbi:hypothetical protein PC129_g22208 [Phytophthora cactorum]|uniref:Secreted protein n=1 Tax=Phytophthora cactorum TaxID=29920 RepID=A0A329RK18_9STRA|nr:hypothetical protein Pcac1_g1244 [Phytophthora cactorum]KAG2797121.1 hypothetical protein PC111_g21428 [Phytophthora cactorum]KAG2820166.1 hypothetical protein PC112_g11878 [Phytophthora cactorum]KAG2836302.1 hypothetical protein PC113_g20048 [Phytophthora cactorum]KAG2876351.1 hypothetical protein PC114_g24237 [Phytophthora cactorum]
MRGALAIRFLVILVTSSINLARAVTATTSCWNSSSARSRASSSATATFFQILVGLTFNSG